MDLEYDEIIKCPVCGGDYQPLGRLGSHMKYKCRNCGIIGS